MSFYRISGVVFFEYMINVFFINVHLVMNKDCVQLICL